MGYRAPSLTELFFGGITSRGTSIGNPELHEETALAIDTGLHWRNDRSELNFHLFRQSFENYIERFDISPNVRGFRNTADGEIQGVELEGNVYLYPGWRISTGFQSISGEDGSGRALADIPANEISLGIEYQASGWTGGLTLKQRFSEEHVAETESPIDSATLLELYSNKSFDNGLTLSLFVKNGLNEAYRIAADELSTLANRSRAGLRLQYQIQ